MHPSFLKIVRKIAVCVLLLAAQWCHGASDGLLTKATGNPFPLLELIVAVQINGQSASDFAVLLQGDTGYYATAQLLTEWRLRKPSAPPLTRNNVDYYPLSALDGVSCRLDSSLQILYLEVPASDFVDSVLQATDRGDEKIAAPDPGAFVNQNFEFTGVDNSLAISGLVETGAFSKLGVVNSRFVSRDMMESLRVTRLDTQFSRDFPHRMATFLIGDTVSATDPWALQVYYGGLRWASKFSTRPTFIPVALPSVSGQVTVPSTVDLYVNNTKVSQQQVDPGPFAIQNIPVMTGQGDITMVVTDLLGKQQRITQSYIRSATMLRKGVSEYSYDAGTLRYGYGMLHSGYTSAFAAATHRYGWSNSLTLNGRAELQARNQTLGGGADFSIPHIGVMSAAIAFSHSARGMGALAYGQFQHQNQSFSFSASVLVAASNFRQLGLLSTERPPRLTAQAQVGHSFGRRLSLATGYLRRQGRSHIDTRNDPALVDSSGVISSLGLRLSKMVTLTSSVNFSAGSKRGTMVNLGLTIPLGPRNLLMASSQISSASKTATLDYMHSAPAGNGYGYRFRGDAADSKSVDAGLYAQTNFSSYSVELGRKPASTSWRVGETSGMVLFHGKVIPTRWLSDSFAVVEVPMSGIRVLANNQFIASTGRRGLVVLPSMVPYTRNTIRLDEQVVPLDLDLSLEERQVVPMPRSGVYIKFSAAKVQGAMLILVDEKGAPIPLGAEVVAKGSAHGDMVAMRGEVFVREIALPATVLARWDDRQCEAAVPALPENEPLPRIGPIVCKRVP